MPRPSMEDELRHAVRAYIDAAEVQRVDVAPLDIKAVAIKVGVSRRILYKYGLDGEIKAAAERQRAFALKAPQDPEQRTLAAELRMVRTELERSEERNRALVARLALVEANATRFGIDPEALYKPMLKPIRSVNRATGAKAQAGKRR